MEDFDDENAKKRQVAVVASVHATVAMTLATTYMLLDIPREPRVSRDAERQSYIDSIWNNEAKCRANLLMGVEAFNHLCDLVRQQGNLIESHNCSLEEILMQFLHLLRHNVRHRVLEGRFWRSRETVSRQFNEALDCVVKLYKPLIADHLKDVHESGTPYKISSDPYFAKYFKDCIGALDGTHINASVPIEEQAKFRGRKSKTTQNVLAACSFDLKFTYVLAGWEGSAHDQRVLDDALVRSNWFIVPQGYTHQPCFLAPYRGTLYHTSKHEGRTSQNEKELFNKRHSSLRNTIERAFGVLKMRWPMLSATYFYPYKTQVKIVLACFVLHYHIMGVDPGDPLLEQVDKDLEANRSTESVEDAPITSRFSNASQRAEWVQFRNGIAKMMFDNKKRRNV